MSKIIIADPIYDVVFKRLMEDTKNARFFIRTLLDQDVEEVEFKPHEYILPELDTLFTENFHIPKSPKFKTANVYQ